MDNPDPGHAPDGAPLPPSASVRVGAHFSVTPDRFELVGFQNPRPSYSVEELRRLRGERIRRATDAKGWKGPRLGAEAGVSKSRISHYEDGSASVPFDVARKIAKALGLSVVDIADVPRVTDGNDFVFHVHLPVVAVVLAAIAPVPDDTSHRDTPTAMAQRRADARQAVKQAVAEEVEQALDAFFERRTRHVETVRGHGRLGAFVDNGHSHAVMAVAPCPPPVTVHDVNPVEFASSQS